MKNMILLIFVSLAISAICKLPLELTLDGFQKFMTAHNKQYETVEEYETRFQIFQENLNKMVFQYKMDPHKYGYSKYMDITQEEFRKTRLGFRVSHLDQFKRIGKTYEPKFSLSQVPESWDWNEQGKVSRVKNQGYCGSCWAFSAVGNMESLNAIHNKLSHVQEFSEQQLVDCDSVDLGCNGGEMQSAFQYVVQNGLESEQDYPYLGRDGRCQAQGSRVALRISSFSNISKDEEEIKRALYEHGPLSVALNAEKLQYYGYGIIDENDCDPQALDHGVLLTGYGTENGKNYWIVKNSWGSDWGESGYFRIVRGRGACGINSDVSTAEI